MRPRIDLRKRSHVLRNTEYKYPTDSTAVLVYEKASDKVIRNELWPVTIDKGFPQHLINTGTQLIFRNKNFER